LLWALSTFWPISTPRHIAVYARGASSGLADGAPGT
jgi:hypothetical protein